jgi:hypothetical protein
VDGAEYTSDQATIWRWRQAYQNDFAARMTWTVADFAHASHRPLPVVNGQTGSTPIEIDVDAGQSIPLDASLSADPDKRGLTYHWFHYAEAGSADGNLAAVTLTGAKTPRVTIQADAPCREPWLPGLAPCKGSGVAHIILAVTGTGVDGTPPMTAYRRIILHVRPAVSK